ncbi:MAG: hypothetical protein LBJ20_07575 [Candidatus Methanoplasma sp.]|jgi:hypothetical protein|nr:hypothetical protein [Candidatus Methanoplasma sp.]
MDAYIIISSIILFCWGLSLFTAVLLYSPKKYAAYRKIAFASMKKIKIIAYCIPLLFSILLAMVWVGMFSNGVYLMIIGTGFLSGLVLFEIFETRKSYNLENENNNRH